MLFRLWNRHPTFGSEYLYTIPTLFPCDANPVVYFYMKSPAAYYLLLLYAFIVCKPLLPWLSDGLAHAFWERNHIATVHQHRGKSHVHNELKEAAKQETTDANTGKNEEPLSVHLTPSHQVDFSRTQNSLQQPFVYLYIIPHPVLTIHIPPPKI